MKSPKEIERRLDRAAAEIDAAIWRWAPAAKVRFGSDFVPISRFGWFYRPTPLIAQELGANAFFSSRTENRATKADVFELLWRLSPQYKKQLHLWNWVSGWRRFRLRRKVSRMSPRIMRKTVSELAEIVRNDVFKNINYYG